MDKKKHKPVLKEIENDMDPLTKEIYNNLNECYYEELKTLADKYLDKIFGKKGI